MLSSKLRDKLSNKMSGTYVPDFLLYDEVTSTNDLLKDAIKGTNTSGMNLRDTVKFRREGLDGNSIISLSQSKGKGRSGRNFFSPPGCSVYFSVCFFPKEPIGQLGVLTPMAASAVYDSIKEVCDVDCGIKWVNDIFVDGRKVCGILTETTLNENSDIPEYVIIGIGLNVFYPKCTIPDDIKDIYGTIYGEQIEYNEDIIAELVSSIISRLLTYYTNLSARTFIDSYKQGLFIRGQEVSYISGNDISYIIVDDVDDDVNLLAHDKNGKEYKFRDGEIRLKLLRK